MKVLLSLLFLICLPTYAQRQSAQAIEGSSDDDSIIEKSNDTLETIVDKIPFEGTREGLKTYKEILFGEEGKAYGTDGSVGASNKGLNNFFSAYASSNSCFADLANAFSLSIKELDRKYKDKKKGPLNGRASQAESAGSPPYSDLKPGFLWELAMKFSNNNPNLAMRLIGVCGHDDVARGYPINCPEQNSVMFLNKALGKDVDITMKLRSDIVKKQAPTKGATYLPSKNYHIYGGAFMACALLEQGTHPALAKTIEEMAAMSYRSIRLSQKTAGLLASRKAAIDEYQKPKKKNIETYLREQFGEKKLAALDAAYLYDKLYFGNNKLHTPIKKPRIRPGGIFQRITEKIQGRPLYVQSWTTERYKKAKAVLDTWIVDIKWTAKQHKVGAEFAVKHCRRGVVDTNFTKECNEAYTCVTENSEISQYVTDVDKILSSWAEEDEKVYDQKKHEIAKKFEKKYGYLPSVSTFSYDPNTSIEALKIMDDEEKAITNLQETKIKILNDFKKKYPEEPTFSIDEYNQFESEEELTDLIDQEKQEIAKLEELKKKFEKKYGYPPSSSYTPSQLTYYESLEELKSFDDDQKKLKGQKAKAQVKADKLAKDYEEKYGEPLKLNLMEYYEYEDWNFPSIEDLKKENEKNNQYNSESYYFQHINNNIKSLNLDSKSFNQAI